ncbi:MAG: hypothetical protein NTW82_12585 [Bacteroidia bacterium]|nr:hypothetical protein [Bacteroidia bacterium]
MNRLLIILSLLVPLACYPQIPANFPVIDKNDLPDAKLQPARHFTGESLFGYMNGGAELYREYGITDAVITEFDLDGGHYKCEVFKMTGPEEAFGIYSVSKYRCLSSPRISQYTCQNRYQLQICKGPYYISIINRSGTSADSVVLLKTGKILEAKINESSPDLSAFIPDADSNDLNLNSILAKGKLGLVNGAADWEDYFKDVTGYYTLIYKTQERTFVSVRFKRPEDFKLFINFHGWTICDLSASDVKKANGEILRMLGENHILVRFNN